jgi:DNA-binding ferritin-like protein (Dps family)
MISSEKYVVRNKDMIWRMVGDEAFIIDKDGTKIHQLNSIGSEIWKISEGNLTIMQIIENICNNFEIAEAQAKADTIQFVENMLSQGLVELKDGPVNP